jgi:hypothetical protein
VKDWKQAERRIAAILGGERVPVSGRGRGCAPDIEHPALSVEVKTRAKLPAWIEDAMRQAEAASEVDARHFDLPHRTPITVLHNDRKPYRDALVLIRLSEFSDLVQSLERDPERRAG